MNPLTPEVIVGEIYSVPSVQGIPVLLPSHVDATEKHSTAKHWHVDNRFNCNVSKSMFTDEIQPYYGSSPTP